MQADCQIMLPVPHWDTLNIEYPVKKFPTTDESCETISRRWRGQPEVLKNLKEPLNEVKEYVRDYNITRELTRSQINLDFGYKAPETHRFNKHTSCIENLYIYPPNRRLADRTPRITAHGNTEMKSAYKTPTMSPKLVTDKDQFKHPATDQFLVEPSWHKELEPLDTTYEGFEKYLDPYLTTSRLHHRPFTADQLNKLSASNNIVTYYTFSNESWVHTPKPTTGDWFLSPNRYKSTYDREKFKEEFREIRTHNKLNWVPGSFRTETGDNYVLPRSHSKSLIENHEEDVRNYHRRNIISLPTNIQQECDGIKHFYRTDYSHIGYGKPLCSVLNQFVKKNKRLERRNV